jgi:hypothetical protein
MLWLTLCICGRRACGCFSSLLCLSDPGECRVRAVDVNERDCAFDGGTVSTDGSHLELIIHGVRRQRDDYRHGGAGMRVDGLESELVAVVHIVSERAR